MDEERSFDVLERDECFALLARVPVARLGVAEPGLAPLIVPVNFVVDDETVVFRSDWGTKLELLRQYPVSLQADEFDQLHHTGWSVLLQGPAHEVDPAELDHLVIHTWAPGERERWVRIEPTQVSGRRIHLNLPPPDGRGYL